MGGYGSEHVRELRWFMVVLPVAAAASTPTVLWGGVVLLMIEEKLQNYCLEVAQITFLESASVL